MKQAEIEVSRSNKQTTSILISSFYFMWSHHAVQFVLYSRIKIKGQKKTDQPNGFRDASLLYLNTIFKFKSSNKFKDTATHSREYTWLTSPCKFYSRSLTWLAVFALKLQRSFSFFICIFEQIPYFISFFVCFFYSITFSHSPVTSKLAYHPEDIPQIFLLASLLSKLSNQ